ncbi:MAG: hypothetical protein RLZZ506_624 [Bacteroidota bacterium]|jgi:hypothetical protein
MQANDAHLKAIAKKPVFLTYVIVTTVSSLEFNFLPDIEWLSWTISLAFSMAWAISLTLVLNEISPRFELETLPLHEGIYLQLRIWLDWILTFLLFAFAVSIPLTLAALALQFVWSIDVRSPSVIEWLQPIKPIGFFFGLFFFSLWQVAMYARGWVIRHPIRANSVEALAWVVANIDKLRNLLIGLAALTVFQSLAELAPDFTSSKFMLQSIEIAANAGHSIFNVWAILFLLEYRSSFSSSEEAPQLQ